MLDPHLILSLLVALACTITVWAGWREWRALRREDRLRQAEYLLSSPLSGAATEGAALGAGAAAASLYDLYAAAADHATVLTELQHRYHLAVPENATPLEWLAFFQNKFGNEHQVQGVLNTMVGALGERASLDALDQLPEVKAAGAHAELFDSPNHPGTDIHFVDGAGNELPEWSVKSYGAMSDFLRAFAQSPQEHTVVNHELFVQLDQSGKLAELKAQGFDILDGQFSHAAHEASGHAAVDALEAGGDVAQHIPVVGLAFFGARTVYNVIRFTRGQSTAAETGVDVAGDAARVGASVAVGVGGAKVGALLGTLVAPGVGTFVGASLGAIVAGIATSRTLSWVKETVKYGTIMSSVRAIGKSVLEKLDHPEAWNEVHEAICDEVYRRDVLYDLRTEEEELASRYEDETRLYSGPYRHPTPMGTLARLHATHLARVERRMSIAAKNVPPRLREFVTGDEHGFLGELVAANAHVFGSVLGDVEAALTNYLRKISSFPHHPLRLRGKDGAVVPSTAVFETLCLEELAKAAEAEEPFAVRGRALNRGVFATAAVTSLATSAVLLAI